MARQALKKSSFWPVYIGKLVSSHVEARGDNITDLGVPKVHFLAPEARQVIENFTGAVIFDDATNCVVRASDPALGFKLDVRAEAEVWTLDIAVVPKLILHLPKEDAACIHVRLRERATKD